MPTYCCLIMFFGMSNTVIDFMTPFDNKLRITFIFFVLTAVFPAANVFLLYRLKRIPQITLSERKYRTYPYLITTVFYFGLFYLMKDVAIWSSVKLFILASAITVGITTLINMKYKISAHAIGIGGLIGAILSFSFIFQINLLLPLIILLLVAGLIGFARLFLQEHNNREMYLGFSLGILIQVAIFISAQQYNFV